ncbi:MAG: Fpg/Nei family DNA glycosylase [Actinomycetota bacterium]|nr:Fpg/Nei family DNA glycosylase [Actinomycetota bacterium]
MPEGHTLRRLADELHAAFAGRPVRVSSPQGRFAADAAVLDGQLVLGARSSGKHVFVEFPGDRFIHVHLGLIGRFDVRPGPAPEPVGQVRLRLVNDTAYADLRGAPQCELIGAAKRAEILARLGPDPLQVASEPAQAWDRIRRSDRPIGALLMDQSVLSGVGNVFRAEILFRHRIHPLRPGKTLRRSQFEAMWDDLVLLLAQGVDTGRIDTVRPEHSAQAMDRPPRKADDGGEVYVYRRNGEQCLVCQTKIRTAVLAGRNLFWCPRCQPRFRSRAVG